jgi:tetratricopeptide (TPR) repeat protein
MPSKLQRALTWLLLLGSLPVWLGGLTVITLRPSWSMTAAEPPPEATAMLQAYRRLKAMRVRMIEEGSGEEKSRTFATLTYRRPDRYRIDYGEDQNGRVLAHNGEETLHWMPDENSFFRQPEWDPTGGMGARWDGFADPTLSLLALLEPGSADRTILERGWIPRLTTAGSGKVGNEECLRLKGRGSMGVPLELWVSRQDGLIRRMEMGVPSAQEDAPRRGIRFEILALNDRVPPTATTFQPPRGAVNMSRPVTEPVPGATNLAQMERRLAAQPGDFKALRMLAQAYQGNGQQALATLMAFRMARVAGTPQEAQDAVGQFLVMGMGDEALLLFVDGIRRFGSKMHLSEEEYSLYSLVQQVQMIEPVRQTLEKAVAQHPDAWTGRFLLAELQWRSGDAGSALEQVLHLLGGIAAGGPAHIQEQLPVVMQFSDLIQRIGPKVGPEDRHRLAAALAQIEDQIPEEYGPSLLLIYQRLNALSDAERVYRRLEPGYFGSLVLGNLAVAFWNSGDFDRADRYFREALSLEVQSGNTNYNSLMQLLALPNARETLVPILRELAAARRENLLQAAHWFAVAGDEQAAARSYEAFLASPAGSPQNAAASKRMVAALAGARVAARAGDPGAVERLARLALEELPFVRAEMPRGQSPLPLVLTLLPSLGDTPARQGVLDRLAEQYPQGITEIMGYGGGPYRLSDGEVRGWLKRAVESAVDEIPIHLAEPLLQRGFKEEVARLLERKLRTAPLSVPLHLLNRSEFTPEVQKRLLSALEGAVRARPGWEPGLRTLISAYQAAEQPARAHPLLQALAARARTAEQFLLLADLEASVGRTARVLEFLRKAARLKPGSLEIQMQLARSLQMLGRRNEALALWRRLQSRVGAEHLDEVIGALQELGARAEALRLLEARYAASRTHGAMQGNLEALRSRLAQVYLEKGRLDQVLSLYPELALFEELPDRVPLDNIYLPLPHEAWPPFISRLEKQKKGAMALRVRLYAHSHGFIQLAPERLRQLVSQAQQMGRLPEVRQQLERMARNNESPQLLILLAEVKEAAGQREEAARLYRRVLLPGGAAAPHLNETAARTCGEYAALLETGKQSEEAERFRRYGRAFTIAREARELADHDQAVKKLKEARLLVPENPCLLFVEMQVMEPGEAATARWEEGIIALTRALPGWEQCDACGQGVLGGDPEKADLAKALSKGDPAGAVCLEAYRMSNKEGADQDQVGRLWLKATQLDPNLALAWSNLSSFYEARGDYREAARAALRAAELLRDNVQAWTQAASLCQQAGLSAEARAAASRVRTLDPAAQIYEPDGEMVDLPQADQELLQILNMAQQWGWEAMAVEQ